MADKININISGSGSITPGEYDNIHVSGSANLHGPVHAEALHISGSCSTEGRLCVSGDIHVSGSLTMESPLEAGSLDVSGSFVTDSPVTVSEKLSVSGHISCDGDIKAETVKLSGSATTSGDIEAERFRSSGRIRLAGMINAEEIDIAPTGNSSVKAIGGSEIIVHTDVVDIGEFHESKRGSSNELASFIHKIISGTSRSIERTRTLNVEESIEGDKITIDHVVCPRVTGEEIVIGDGCEIDLVQYTGSLVVKGGIVKQQEKI